jgi:hypothetical protein
VLDNQQTENMRKPVFDYMVYYNLACYHALYAQKKSELCTIDRDNLNTTKMFRYLQYALKQNKTLGKWVAIDPSFAWIQKKQDKLSDKFYEIIKSLDDK